MQVIRIEDEYHEWIEGRVRQTFESVGVKLTQPAGTMLAYVLQSQKEEGLVREDAQLFEQAESLLFRATRIYVDLYGTRPMTVNRALHLIVQANQTDAVFPSGPTD
jgi:hypothetical protein